MLQVTQHVVVELSGLFHKKTVGMPLLSTYAMPTIMGPSTVILAPAVLFLCKAQVSVLVSQRLPFRVSHAVVPIVLTPKAQ